MEGEGGREEGEGGREGGRREGGGVKTSTAVEGIRIAWAMFERIDVCFQPLQKKHGVCVCCAMLCVLICVLHRDTFIRAQKRTHLQ